MREHSVCANLGEGGEAHAFEKGWKSFLGTNGNKMGSLVRASDIAQLRDATRQRTLTLDHVLDSKIAKREEARRFSSHVHLFIGLSVACAGVYVYLKLTRLSSIYAAAYAWWGQAKESGEPGRGAHILITVPNMALRVEFPAYYWLQNMRMAVPSISLAGAEFLLIVATHFSTGLRPAHWNGSAEQLRFKDIDLFLPLQKGADWDYIWTAWSATNAAGERVNPWAGVLYASRSALANSPAMKAYYANPPDRGFVEALFRGGLAEIAVNYATDKTNGEEMVRHLIGYDTKARVLPCAPPGVRMATSAMAYGSMSSMAAGMSGQMMDINSQALSHTKYRIAALATLAGGGFAAGAVAGSRPCKQRLTSYSGTL